MALEQRLAMTKRGSDSGRHLDISHLRDDLIARSVRGGTIILVAQGLKVVIQFGAIVVLARLLAPADFGVFAMVGAFLAVLELLKDLGLSTATIQRPDITQRQVSTLFWLNCCLGIAIAVLLAVLAPVLAWFYGQPVLLRIAPAVAATFLFTGIAAQHLALLRRQMRFGAAAAVQLGSEASALIAAVVAASFGLGIWALVIQRLIWALVMAAGAWSLCDWCPGRPGPFAEVRGLVNFGANATGSMVINAFAHSIDKVLIGWYWGGMPLGLFERAEKLIQQPIQNVNVPLATVALSTLSRMLDQPDTYRTSYMGIVQRLTMLMAPIAAVIVAAAGPVVMFVLGPQWRGAVPALAWMGVALVCMPVTYSLSWLYMSQDRTREMLRAGLVNSTIGIAALLAGLPFGIIGVAGAYAITDVAVRGPILFWFAGRRGPVPVRTFYRILALPSLAAALGAGAIVALRTLTVVGSWPLVLAVPTFGFLACGVALAVYGASPDGRRILGTLPHLPGYLVGKAVRA